MNDSELEKWHDYEVSSSREILMLLRRIGEQCQLVRILVGNESDTCLSSILDVDPDSGKLTLEASIDSEQNQRILNAGRLFFETSLDKVRILFATDAVRPASFGGRAAFVMALPPSLIRLQRREFYRMTTPISNPVRVTIPLPVHLGSGFAVFPLADISGGGVALLDNKLQLDHQIGHSFADCRIDLPEFGPVLTGLQVRNFQDMTLLNNKTNRRIGCQFVGLSRAAEALLQRYITKLERERKVRLGVA